MPEEDLNIVIDCVVVRKHVGEDFWFDYASAIEEHPMDSTTERHPILRVGTVTEDADGGLVIEGWSFAPTAGSRSWTLDELREEAARG